MTLRMYARQKGLPPDRVQVRLKHSKVHAADCEHCEAAAGRIDRIECEIERQGPLDDSQRRLEIADKCPVHRTLHGEVDEPTRLKDRARLPRARDGVALNSEPGM